MFHATGGRCAVDLSELNLPISREEALRLLASLGFRVIDVDLVRLARSQIGVSGYLRGALPADDPEEFDCSLFVKWLYAQRGVWLPRRTIQQIDLGAAIHFSELAAGDAVFTTGRINYYRDDPACGVGHVGIATGKGAVVHAANSRAGIIESRLEDFLRRAELRGIRRYIRDAAGVITLETLPRRQVETSDDIRWILLQNLDRT
jgi:hypothetical protein